MHMVHFNLACSIFHIGATVGTRSRSEWGCLLFVLILTADWGVVNIVFAMVVSPAVTSRVGSSMMPGAVNTSS